MRLLSLTLILLLAACVTEKTVSIDPGLQENLEAMKERDGNALKEEQRLKEEQEQQIAKEFLDTKAVNVPALDIKARPISGKAAIDAAVLAYDKTGEIDPIITETNKISFPFGLSQAKIACAQLRVCSIGLQPGEQVLDLVTGDSQRWNISVAKSGTMAGAERPHIMVKPLADGDLVTNLIITTDRRVYNIDMVAVSEGQYTPQIDFYYPHEPMVTSVPKPAPLAVAATPNDRSVKENPVATLVALDNMNFGYALEGKESLAWYPLRVFDDGSKVFIQMKSSLKSAEAPVFLVENEGKQEIVNYRYKAPYYVIDRLFDKGILILGSDKKQEIITISKKKQV